MKRGEHIPTDAEVIAAVDTLIEGYMNCDDYGGSVAEDKGKSRIQVWHESLHLHDALLERLERYCAGL